MKMCEHTHFDFEQTTGPGYVVCRDCKKSVPVERALLSMDRRIRNLEHLTLKLTKESHDDSE